MSNDARNSLIAWVSVLALSGFFWISLRFDLVPDIPSWSAPVGFGFALLAQLFSWVRFKRRAEKSE